MKKMDEKFQKKICKLFETRLNLENELVKGHSLKLDYIENNSRTVKTEKAGCNYTIVKLLWKKLLK